jgi:hypothetical protein
MSDYNYLTLITCYHFGRSDIDAYPRLLRSLRASVREVGKNGRVILVANGTKNDAELPLSVIRDLPLEAQKVVVPVTLQSNARNIGGLNAGVAYALKFSPDCKDEWIGSVQSSVVLQPGWRGALFSGTSTSAAIFGRLTYEDDPSLIWADGHELKDGKTWNVASNCSISSAPEWCPPHRFPCLSAAVFHRKAVESVVTRYGSMVGEKLPHYGDCTDAALRLRDCAHDKFDFRQAAIALKRRPIRDLTQEGVVQLVTARLYYENRQQCAEERLKTKRPMEFVDAKRQADEIVSAPYAVTGVPPPSARPIDDGEWP